MKGLLLKDLYTILKQMKFIVLIVIVFAIMPGYSMTLFAMTYAGMMPITALAYDERSKWDKLAAMMPYSAKDIVLEKYLLGYLLLFGAAIVSLIAQIGINLVLNTQIPETLFSKMLIMLCGIAIFEAINLPVMMKMGVERGRIVFIILMGLTVCGVTLIDGISQHEALFEGVNKLPFALSVLLVTVVLSVISIMLSIRIYKNKEI